MTVTNLGSMNSPVELALYDRSGSEIERRWLAGFSGMKNVSLPEGAEKAVIDPDNIMPDINRENNTTSQPLKFNFVFDQPTFHLRDVNYLPWLNGNAFNGVTPGVYFTQDSFPASVTGLQRRPCGISSTNGWWALSPLRGLSTGVSVSGAGPSRLG